MVPFYSWWAQAHAVENAPSGWLPGETKLNTIQRLFALPLPQAQAEYKAAIQYLKSKNINEATDFAHAVLSYSTSDEYLDNAFGIADIAGVAPVVKGLAEAGKAAVAARRTTEAAIDTARLVATDIRTPEKAVPTRSVEDFLNSGAATPEYANDNPVRGPTVRTKTFENFTSFNAARPPEAANDLAPGVKPPAPVTVRSVSGAERPRLGTAANQNTVGSSQVSANDLIEQFVQEQHPELVQRVADADQKVAQIRSQLLVVANEKARQDTGAFINSTKSEQALRLALNTAQQERAALGPELNAARQQAGLVLGESPDSPDIVVQGQSVRPRLGPKQITGRDSQKTQILQPANDLTGFEAPQGVYDRSVYRESAPAGVNDNNPRPGGRAPRNGPWISPMKPTASNDNVTQVKQAMIDSVQALEGPGLKPEEVFSGLGDSERAARVGSLERTQAAAAGQVDPMRELPTGVRMDGFFTASKNLGREAAQRLQREFLASQGGLISSLTDVANVARLTKPALDAALSDAWRGLRNHYGNRLADGVIDLDYIPAEVHPANVDTAVLRIGRPQDAKMFSSSQEAERARDMVYKFSPEEARIVQQGQEFYLELSRHINENQDLVREAFQRSPGTQAPKGMMHMLTNRIRSAEDIVDRFSRGQRHLATHLPAEIEARVKQFVKDNIGSLPSKSRKAVEDILRVNRDMPDPRMPSERGYFYQSAGEFERAFHRLHGRVPTEAETNAYASYIALSDFDWTIRNLALYRDKAIRGVERFKFPGAPDWVEGIPRQGVPWSTKAEHNATVLVSENGRTRTVSFQSAAPKDVSDINDLVSNHGYKVYQVWNAREYPFSHLTGNSSPVNFVVSRDFDRASLAAQQVEYRPGGHSIYAHEHYTAQPSIDTSTLGRPVYYGDVPLTNHASSAEAKHWAQRLDQARQIMQTQDDVALAKYLGQNLPYSLKEFKGMFEPFGGRLKIDVPITIRQNGINTLDTDLSLKGRYKGLIDETRNPYDPSNGINKAFLSERDQVIKTISEPQTGVFRVADAEQLDPFVAFNRAFGQGLRNRYMADYKQSALQNWITQFGKYLRVDPETLKAYPGYFLYNADGLWTGTPDKVGLAAAKAARRALIEFIGTRSEVGETVSYIEDALKSTVFNTLGQDPKAVAANRFASLSSIRNPAAFMKSVAFHSKLGMFNPVQFMIQAQQAVHSMAVTGIDNGLRGMAAGVLAQFGMHTRAPAIIDKLADVAHTMGYDRSLFQEMMQTLDRTGLNKVGSEIALRDDVFDPKLFRSSAGTFLDKGTWFFNKGEELGRLTGFASAFREWRLANPGIRIGNRELQEVMSRADDLAGNMTRASQASWQKGVWGIPTQFFGFQARLLDQMLGKRLTAAEKLRAFTVYSALYGIPVGVSIGTLGLVPGTNYDDIRQYALDHGLPINDLWYKALEDGLPSAIFKAATGHEYNVPQRFGPGASTDLRDTLFGDKSLHEILLGASGSVLGDILKSSQPFVYWTSRVFSGPEDSYPLKTSDWMGLFRNISSVDAVTKAYAAASYQKWITKNNVSLGPADNLDAAAALLGLTPQRYADTYLSQKGLSSQAKSQKVFEQEAIQNYTLGLKALKDGDEQGWLDYQQRARVNMIAGDFNIRDQQRIMSLALRAGRDLADQVDWARVQRAPQSQATQRFNQYYDDLKRRSQ
jgi:hypothetical protein